MVTRKILATALIAGLIGFGGAANADIKLQKTTDGTEFKITNPKAYGDTKKKDNVKTKAEIEF